MKPKSKRMLSVTGAILVIIALLVAFSAFYSQGYRLSFKPLGIVDPGTLAISNLQDGDTVHVDGVRKNISIQNSEASLALSRGEHEIVLSRQRAFPYSKTISIAERGTETLNPFFLSEQPIGKLVEADGENGKTLLNLLLNQPVPNMESPRRSFTDDVNSNDAVLSYVSGNSILASWIGAEDKTPNAFCDEQKCEKQIVVTVAKAPVDGLDFYPGRNDVLIFSTDGDIYAIELDKKPIQNFQPILMGDGKAFFMRVPNSQELWVHSSSTILNIELPK